MIPDPSPPSYIKRAGEQVKVTFASSYREVVVMSAPAVDITDIDRLDGPGFDTFIEEKNGAGLLKVPAAKQAAAVQRWVQENITEKAGKYVDIATSGLLVREGEGYAGADQPPTIDYLKQIRHIRFEVKAATLQVPGFQQAADAAINALRTQNPGWTIDLVYVP